MYMKKTIVKKILSVILGLTMAVGALAGCSTQTETAETTNPPASNETAQALANQEETLSIPKYVFLFIGDGMSYVQVNAAQVYLGNNTSGEVETESLNFTQFPVAGSVTTYDSTSFCPDSASTATALSCGVKTHSASSGLDVDNS
jgi:alkaline phosphatase